MTADFWGFVLLCYSNAENLNIEINSSDFLVFELSLIKRQ